jgi:hypothetical protein
MTFWGVLACRVCITPSSWIRAAVPYAAPKHLRRRQHTLANSTPGGRELAGFKFTSSVALNGENLPFAETGRIVKISVATM